MHEWRHRLREKSVLLVSFVRKHMMMRRETVFDLRRLLQIFLYILGSEVFQQRCVNSRIASECAHRDRAADDDRQQDAFVFDMMEPAFSQSVHFIIDEEQHHRQHEEPYQCEEEEEVLERDEVLILVVGVKSLMHEYRRVDED